MVPWNLDVVSILRSEKRSLNFKASSTCRWPEMAGHKVGIKRSSLLRCYVHLSS